MRLSDIQGEDAVDLWADLLDPICTILQDKDVATAYRANVKKTELATLILRNHKKETVQILTRIDPAPINAINIVLRIIDLIQEIENSDDLKSFFDSAGQTKTESGSFGSVMENSEESAL